MNELNLSQDEHERQSAARRFGLAGLARRARDFAFGKVAMPKVVETPSRAVELARAVGPRARQLVRHREQRRAQSRAVAPIRRPSDPSPPRPRARARARRARVARAVVAARGSPSSDGDGPAGPPADRDPARALARRPGAPGAVDAEVRSEDSSPGGAATAIVAPPGRGRVRQARAQHHKKRNGPCQARSEEKQC